MRSVGKAVANDGSRMRRSITIPCSRSCRGRAASDKDVEGALAREVARAFIAERAQVEVPEQLLAGAEQHGSDREMQLVDETRAQVLTDGVDASAQAYVAAAGGAPRLCERRMNALRDEAELGSARHRERRARVVRQHEHGGVIGGLLAPPPLPALVRPRPAHRTEHVAPEDPGAQTIEAPLGDRVVDPGLAVAAALLMHAPPEPRPEEPLHQLRAADAERVIEALVRSRPVAVDGDCEAADEEPGHQIDPPD